MEPLRDSDYSQNSYEQLPSGYNTLCGLKGSKFSGGQKQRIAVARAIITKPQVLMLDEATSALDEESQRKVQDALDKVMNDRTSIVIAHRLTTIQKCDRLIVLDQGVVSEEGTYNDLIRSGGMFAQISNDMQS
jgi:ABC-type multidrug transport system fused ATPase/permease subunit